MTKKKHQYLPNSCVSVAKMKSLEWSSPIYPHGEGHYQGKTFKDNIPGYPGYYISKRGKVYSRWDINGKAKLNKIYHKKSQHHGPKGRLVVKLSQPGVGSKNWQVHRLVAIVYIPNPEDLPYVCHKDNDYTNNNVQNLYWGSQKDNMSQASAEGRMNPKRGESHPSFKGKEIQRSYIPRLREAGFTNGEIGEILDIGEQAVRKYYYKYLEKYGK